MAWRADLGLGGHSTRAAPMYTLLDRRRVVSATGVARWEYRRRYLDGVASEWVSKAELPDSFTSLQLDTFHGLWNLYEPSSERNQPPAPDARTTRRPMLSMREAFGEVPDRHEGHQTVRGRQRDIKPTRTGLRLLSTVLARPLLRQRLGGVDSFRNNEIQGIRARPAPGARPWAVVIIIILTCFVCFVCLFVFSTALTPSCRNGDFGSFFFFFNVLLFLCGRLLRRPSMRCTGSGDSQVAATRYFEGRGWLGRSLVCLFPVMPAARLRKCLVFTWCGWCLRLMRRPSIRCTRSGDRQVTASRYYEGNG